MSTDGGRSWADPLVINDASPSGRPKPAVAISGDGAVYVGWYHAIDAERAEYRLATLPEGRLDHVITASTNAAGESDQGDYSGMAGLPRGVLAVWVARGQGGTDTHASLARLE